jgi:LUD domain
MSFFKKIFGTSDDAQTDDKTVNYNDLTNKNLSVEEIFTSEFMKNGGKFIYCDDLNELKEQFLNILEENDWFECETLCFDAQLFSLLEENKLNYINPEKPKFLFTTCESLIAEEGSILFSSNQIKSHKPNELPANIVVFATTNQIKETKTDALQTIRIKYNNQSYPSNITAIKYFNAAQDESFMQYGSSPKNLYLLLLEDH